MSQYVDRKTVNDSYRPTRGAMSPGLKRAREPYRIRNAITGLVLGAFAVGIWAYSISAVKQDVFDDMDEEVRAMARAGTTSQVSGDDESKTAAAAALGTAISSAETTEMNATVMTGPANPSAAPSHPGLLLHLDKRFPRLLDPQNKTLVWGAPPLDDVGKMRRS